MCFACPEFFLLVIDPTFPPQNLSTDLTNWYKKEAQRPKIASKSAAFPWPGDWFRRVIKPGQSEPLDLTGMWVYAFPFFLRHFVLFPLANEKFRQIQLWIRNCSTELCPSSLYYNPFFLFLSLSFLSPPTQLLRIEDLNFALSFNDVAMKQNANLRISLAPDKLHCNSTAWYLEIQVKGLVWVVWTGHPWTDDLRLTPIQTHTMLYTANVFSIIFCVRSKCYMDMKGKSTTNILGHLEVNIQNIFLPVCPHLEIWSSVREVRGGAHNCKTAFLIKLWLPKLD